MSKKKCLKLFLMVTLLLAFFYVQPASTWCAEKIGVLYALHGGMDTLKKKYMWDVSIMMFSYDQNHAVYNFVIWNPAQWPSVLDTETTDFAARFIRKYQFSYPRIGGFDPFQTYSNHQLEDMKAELDRNPYGIQFEVDWVGWIPGDNIDHYPYPRYIYNPQKPGGSHVTYCGEGEKDEVVIDFYNGTKSFHEGATLWGQTSWATATIDSVVLTSGSWSGGDATGTISLSNVNGSFQADEIIVDTGSPSGNALANSTTHWADCDPERFNVDGPVERLLKKGVSKVIIIDTTVGAVRFYKTFDIVQMSKRVLAEWNAAHGTSIPLIWINDYTNFMERTYPTEPEGWTPFLGPPITDQHADLNTSPNPVAEDPELALLHVVGIEDGMSDAVSDAETGVVLFNHGLFDPDRRFFDPKMNDTIVLEENIKALLLERHPDMDPDNIIGAFGGIKQINPENGIEEVNRAMRGENLAHAYLLEADEELSGHPWGYRYWEALEYLKNRGVKHIVIDFSQVITDSVLSVELYNQIAKEIGIKTWLKWGIWDYDKYPVVGHPFADYWGNWVNTDCGGEECCFIMGGCSDGRPYPPPRQTPLDRAMSDLDPALAFDNSDFGHLGYDPALGPPDPDHPVQDQYTGTWELYTPPSDDPRVGQLLAKHVLAMAVPTSINLSTFRAQPGNSMVSLLWSTASETNNAGFNLYRAEKEDGNYARINATLIPAQGSVAKGATYNFLDKSVQNRKTYYYKLEDIDVKGRSILHGPVHATPRLVYGKES